MAFGNINPYFLPWQHQGIDFLLADETVPAGLSLCHAPAKAPQKTTPKRAIPTQHYAAAAPQAQSQRQAQPIAPPSGSAAHGAVRQTPPPPSALPIRAQDVPKHTLQEASRPTMPPMEHLPHLWQERLQATKPNAVLWTYWSLGYDLCGYPSDARRALLKKIIVDDLQQSFKDYSLWPSALPDTAAQSTLPELIPHAQAFWTGVQRLNARGLVIFGSAAAKAVGLQKEAKPAKLIKHNGCRVLFVNDMDYLVENSSYYQSMLASLKPFLKQFLHW